MSRMTCNLAVPVTLSKGKRLRIKGIDVEGSVELQNKSSLALNSELFFAGSKGALNRDSEMGELRKNLNFKHSIDLKSDCGSSTLLRLNESLMSTFSGLVNHASITKNTIHYVVESCE